MRSFLKLRLHTGSCFDLETGFLSVQVADPSVAEGYTCASFHPDGLILGTGTAESLVRIWDVKSQVKWTGLG
jgi:pre-mRNA-processing factor 19